MTHAHTGEAQLEASGRRASGSHLQFAHPRETCHMVLPFLLCLPNTFAFLAIALLPARQAGETSGQKTPSQGSSQHHISSCRTFCPMNNASVSQVSSSSRYSVSIEGKAERKMQEMYSYDVF